MPDLMWCCPVSAPLSRLRARIASVGIPSGSLRHWRNPDSASPGTASLSWSNIWIYLLADFAAGAAAALAFCYLNPDDLHRADPHLHLAVHASDASHPSS